jgi:hypothetical protein
MEKSRVLEIDKDAQLEEISPGFILDYREPSDCQNMSELFQLAQNRGYKKGWAYHQGKRLGYI